MSEKPVRSKHEMQGSELLSLSKELMHCSECTTQLLQEVG